MLSKGLKVNQIEMLVSKMETENGRRLKYHRAYAKFALTFVGAFILYEVALYYLNYVTGFSSDLYTLILIYSFIPALAIIVYAIWYLRKKFSISKWW